MAIHRTPEEKMEILNDYFESKLNVSEYSRSRGIPKSTLFQWLTKYYNNTSNTKLENTTSFMNVTSEVKNISMIPKAKTEEIPISINNQISMKIGTITMEFDITNLKNVLEVINNGRFN